MNDFWQLLPKPFFVLAPMEDVTDVSFRELVATTLPKPDVFFTEFTNTDALFSNGKESALDRLQLTENQRPVIAQIWGTNPENFYKAGKLIKDLRFNGVDINMGCPAHDVTKKGAGAAMCLNQELAKEIIAATKEGAKGIAVSVKTRIGFKKIITEEWIGFLLSQNLTALTVHGRTAEEQSKVPAHWDEIGKCVQLRNEISKNTILIGNGDVKSYAHGMELVNQYGVDGIMIGRGIFSNPWVFEKEERKHERNEYITVLIKHLDLWNETWGERRHFAVMKKFFKMYVNGFPGASDMRVKLMECKSYDEVMRTLSKIALID